MSKCPPAESLNVEFYPEDKNGQRIRPCRACKETRAAREACLQDQVISLNVENLFNYELFVFLFSRMRSLA